MKFLSSLVFLSFLVSAAGAAPLAGVRIETLGSTSGFASSLAVDSAGTIYYTVTSGTIFRFERDGRSTPVATLPTHSGGNGGLLGMALLDDRTAVVHYTTWDETGERVLDDVISTVDLLTGFENTLHLFVGDIQVRDRGVNSEHHGGNPTVAADGSIFVGIGDYAGGVIASVPEWNGGKIWRLWRDGRVEQYARGLRNPYDLAFDDTTQRLIVADNGPEDGDEINVVTAGSNLGWPFTFGNQPPIDNGLVPAYVFPHTVAPTGLHRVSGKNPLLRHGILLAAFVGNAIYYFPDVTTTAVAAPIALVDGFDSPILDVTEGPDGDIYFASAFGIHRLDLPAPGDCNGDLLVDSADVRALLAELADGDPQPAMNAGRGAFAGSWGCDANEDSVIDNADLTAISALVPRRTRAVSHR